MAAGTAKEVPTAWYKGEYVTLPGQAGFEGVWEIWNVTTGELALRNIATAKGAKIPQPGQLLRLATHAEIGEATATATKVNDVGLVIKFTANPKAPKGLYVVIKLNPSGTFNCTRLGGDGGRYFRNILPAQVEVIPVTEIAAAQEGAGQ